MATSQDTIKMSSLFPVPILSGNFEERDLTGEAAQQR